MVHAVVVAVVDDDDDAAAAAAAAVAAANTILVRYPSILRVHDLQKYFVLRRKTNWGPSFGYAVG